MAISSAARLQMINGAIAHLRHQRPAICSPLSPPCRAKNSSRPRSARSPMPTARSPRSGPPGRKLLSPRTLGLLLKTRDAGRGRTRADVGGGAGYCAALLARARPRRRRAGDGLERRARRRRFARRRHTSRAADTNRRRARRPFDVIVVNGAFEVTPDPAHRRAQGRAAGWSASSAGAQRQASRAVRAIRRRGQRARRL